MSQAPRAYSLPSWRRSVNGSLLQACPSTGTVSTWPDSAMPPAASGPMMAWRLALPPVGSWLTRYGTPCASSQPRTKSISARLELRLVVSKPTRRASISTVLRRGGEGCVPCIAAVYTGCTVPQPRAPRGQDGVYSFAPFLPSGDRGMLRAFIPQEACMLLGAIADDFTGATDLASMLVRGGMRTVQLIGVPAPGEPVPDADAVVVALKSRTAPVRQAVAESLAALAWLRAAGAGSSSSSTAPPSTAPTQGNIGPVADALIAALGCGFALACPAFPANARSVYPGPSVRRRRAAERERHGAPSADADDRRQPGARAVAADRRHRGPRALRDGRAGRRGDPPGDDRAEGAGPALRHRRCGRATRT